jgi:hypothetical protein
MPYGIDDIAVSLSDKWETENGRPAPVSLGRVRKSSLIDAA